MELSRNFPHRALDGLACLALGDTRPLATAREDSAEGFDPVRYGVRWLDRGRYRAFLRFLFPWPRHSNIRKICLLFPCLLWGRFLYHGGDRFLCHPLGNF